jgi:hypothetical protein
MYQQQQTMNASFDETATIVPSSDGRWRTLRTLRKTLFGKVMLGCDHNNSLNYPILRSITMRMSIVFNLLKATNQTKYLLCYVCNL